MSRVEIWRVLAVEEQAAPKPCLSLSIRASKHRKKEAGRGAWRGRNRSGRRTRK